MRLRLALATLALLAGASIPTSAKPEPGPGYVKSSNVTHLLTVPLEADAAGARLLGKTFYVLTARGVTIYDVSNPTLPTPVGTLPLPFTPNQEREDIDTNGKILVAGQSYTGLLHIVDVSSPRLPALLGTHTSAGNHTNTCVLSCSWVYGSEGTITDIRDPRNPKIAGNWMKTTEVRGSHDLTEVRPGLLAVASNPIAYLDARDPANPRLIGSAAMPGRAGYYYTHQVAWPRAGADRWFLAGTESGYGCADPAEGSLQVYDTRDFGRTNAFRYTGQYTLTKGLPTEGKAHVNELCGHWFQPHPTFRDGGLVAVAWYGFGTRFVEVTPAGTVKERGFFLPVGHTSSVYWVGDDIVYALDYTARGFDILRFDRTKPAEVDPAHPGRYTSTPAPLTRPPVRRDRPWVCPVPIANS